MSPLVRLIYASIARGYAVQHAIGIQQQASVFNSSVGITGILVASQHRFMQVLEGPEREVRNLFSRISKDPRHEHCTLLSYSKIDFRLWPSWSMQLISESEFVRRSSEWDLDARQLPYDSDSALRWVDLLYSFAEHPISDHV